LEVVGFIVLKMDVPNKETDKLIKELVEYYNDIPSVHGVFIAGSLANSDIDIYSDVDLCIVFKDKHSLEVQWEDRLLTIDKFNKSVSHFEKTWGITRMISALYNKVDIPPIGLQVDYVYGILDEIEGLMCWTKHEIILDKTGQIKNNLYRNPESLPDYELNTRLVENSEMLPFYIYDAQKSLLRKDVTDFASQINKILNIYYFSKSVVENNILLGSKRTTKLFTPDELKLILSFYCITSQDEFNKFVNRIMNVVTESFQTAGLFENATSLKTNVSSVLDDN